MASGPAGGQPQSTPEASLRVSVDLGQQRVDVRGGADSVVSVPAQIGVPPVEVPEARGSIEPQLGDRNGRPLRTDRRGPWRPVFDDRHGLTVYVDFEPDLMPSAGRDAALCEATDLRKVNVQHVRQRCGHVQRLAGHPEGEHVCWRTARWCAARSMSRASPVVSSAPRIRGDGLDPRGSNSTHNDPRPPPERHPGVAGPDSSASPSRISPRERPRWPRGGPSVASGHVANSAGSCSHRPPAARS
jgi:hypothetical protein